MRLVPLIRLNENAARPASLNQKGREMPMRSISKLRPSPAMVIALVALVIAAAGVAVAQPGATSSKKSKGVTAKKAKKIANTQIAALGNPIAFAHVSASGVVDSGRSKNVATANVTAQGSGIYCFRNLGFAFKGADITTDYDDSSNEFDPQFGVANPGPCASPAQAYVAMVTNNGAAAINGGFYIAFYN
jgi:hypothetical protein